MGAIRGSISYTKFYVVGELPQDFQQTFTAAVQARVVEPLQHDSDDEQHHGWCAVDKPFELAIDEFSMISNEYVTLGMRIDKWRLQAPLLKAKIEEAEAVYRERTQRERIGKRQRAEIKLTVVRQLRKQTIPTTKSYDLAWNTTEKIVMFWSKSSKILDLFQELFEKTFKLKLVPESPVATAIVRLKFNDGQCEALSAVEPAAFTFSRE